VFVDRLVLIELLIWKTIMTLNHPDGGELVFDFDTALEAIDLDQVPIDAQACLVMNQAYQQQLEQFVVSVTVRIEENRERQSLLKDRMQDKAREGNASKTLFAFRHPYFRDMDGYTPPANSDTTLKQHNQELNQGYTSNRRLWFKSNQTVLKQLVQQFSAKHQTQELRRQKEALIIEQDECDDEQRAKAIDEQLRVLNRGIDRLTEQEKCEIDSDPQSIDWLYIARLTETDALNCRLFWQNCLSGTINQRKWTMSEAERLRELTLNECANDWEQIAIELGTRRKAWQVCRQFQISFNSNVRRNGSLTDREKQLLESVVHSCAIGEYINWQQVKYFFDGRSTTQLRAQWAREKAIQRGPSKPWYLLEDLTLMIAFRKYEKWNDISHYLPDRSSRSCMDRFRRLITFNPRLRSELRNQATTKNDEACVHKSDMEGSHPMMIELLNRCREVTDDEHFLRKARIQLCRNKDSVPLLTEDTRLAKTWSKLKHLSRKAKNETEEQIDAEITELFANYDLFPQKYQPKPLQKTADQMFLETRVLNRLSSSMKGSVDDKRFLGDTVLEYVFQNDITQRSPTHKNLPAILPPNRTTLNTFFALLVIKNSIAQNFTQYSVRSDHD
jgi:hypothetical protein